MATTTTEIRVELENEPGTLGEAAETLGEAGVNVLGFDLAAEGATGTARIVADDPQDAASTLRAEGFPVQTEEILLVTAPNRPGELGRIGTELGNSGVNIEKGFPVFDPTTEEATLAFEVDDLDSARKVLG